MSFGNRGAGGPEVVSRAILAGDAFPRENQSTCYRAGRRCFADSKRIGAVGICKCSGALRFRVGMSLACGLIWTSAALGDHDGSFAAPVVYATGDAPYSVAIGDLDGDQVLDLVLAIPRSDRVSVLLGVGDGTFVDAVNYAVADGTEFVAIGDLDGDLVPDLAVANDNDSVSILLGVGDGTFAAAVHYATGVGPISLVIADLDGDQVPDLAVAINLFHHVAVLLGVGDGTFAAPVNYAGGNRPTSVATGDLDGDQIPDLAVANWGSDSVSILLGVGDGTFAAAVPYAAGEKPQSVAIGDLNGDQVPDLAVANDVSDDVSVLLGVGDGTFVPAVHYAAGNHSVSVAIADLSGDQLSDLAVATFSSGGASVLLGAGDGTFAARVQLDAGVASRSIAIDDLNGDQAPDLAVAMSNGVAVLLGLRSGTCCHSNDCSMVTRSDCLDSGGSFSSHNTTCDEDTDGDGVSDACDPCPFSNPDDIDGDGVCQSSDACPGSDDAIDSDGDGVPDGCDACDNNVPGECTFVSPILAAAPHDILKNRYISIDPRGQDAFNEGGAPFDIRVRLSSTLVNGVTPFGYLWWANLPDAKCISIVGPTQPASPPDWSGCPTLHLTGCPIIPTSTYEIAAVVNGLQSGPPLMADTQAKPGVKWHGDCVGFFDGVMWTPPNGTTSIDDLGSVVKAFQDLNAFNAPHVTVADLHPNQSGTQINKIVNFDDVLVDILGFRGFEYPGPQIELCPDP